MYAAVYGLEAGVITLLWRGSSLWRGRSQGERGGYYLRIDLVRKGEPNNDRRPS
jgi:hypothetical protein